MNIAQKQLNSKKNKKKEQTSKQTKKSNNNLKKNKLVVDSLQENQIKQKRKQQINIKITAKIQKRAAMHLLQKLTRFHRMLTMIKEHNQWTQQKHMHMERAKAQYVKGKNFNLTIQQNNTRMINCDCITKENKRAQSRLATNSRSSMTLFKL